MSDNQRTTSEPDTVQEAAGTTQTVAVHGVAVQMQTAAERPTVPEAPQSARSPLHTALSRARRAGTGFVPSPHRPGDDGDTRTGQPGRLPKPVRAGALIGGLVLVAGAFTVSGMHHDDHRPPRPTAGANPLGGDPNGGYTGAVPGAMPAPLTSSAPTGSGPATANPAGSALTAQAAGPPVGNHDTGTRSTGGSGAGSSSGSSSSSTQRSAAQPAAQPAVTSSATAGPGCGSAYRQVGFYTDGWAGWLHTGGGCGAGTYDSLPESGDAGSADPTLYSLWSFSTGAVRSGRCTVSVYVPDSGDIRYVGGAPAHYVVSGVSTATFTIDQPSHRSAWVNAGTYDVNGGTLTVKLTNTGQDWAGSTKTYRHVAAGDIRINCTAS